MVDMDQTLIESVTPDSDRYESSNGEKIVYETTLEQNGIPVKHIQTIKVSIRPLAIEMVHSIVSSGHKYILWSAGTYDYVHAVMRYFSLISGVTPQVIYTRRDMVGFEGQKYKSMVSKGYRLEDFIILEDNPNLVHPNERSRIVKVDPWIYENINDTEMLWVTQLFQLYAQNKASGRTFRLICAQ